MLDRPSPDPIASDAAEPALSGAAPPGRAAPRWPLAFVGIAGILGAAGVVVGAAGAHVAARGGAGEVARTASEFLLVHAAAVLAGSGAAAATARGRVAAGVLATALGLLAAGAALFGGELALAALLDWRPLPLAAPAGGLCLIAGWLCLSVAAAVAARRR